MAAGTTSLTSSSNPSACGELVTITATVSPVPPETAIPTGTVTFSVDGVEVAVPLDGTGQATLTSMFTTGVHTITAAYSGDGTFDSSTAPPLTQTTYQATATTVVASAPNPSVCCQPVTFTATVTADPPSGQVPTGTVTVSVDGVPGTPAPLLNSVATVMVDDLSAGAHLVTATYNGDACFAGSVGTAGHTVVKAPTTTTVTSTPSPSICCAPVTVTATVAAVTPSTCPPTGTVLFVISNDGPALTAPLDAGGQATVTVSSLTAGNHSIIAFYNGDACFDSSASSPAPHSVAPAGSVTTVTATPSPSVCCQPATFTVHVAPVAPATCTPTGTVSLTVDGVPVGSGVLSGGTATISAGALTAGTHTVTATYGGNGCFTSSAATTTHTVTKAATVTTSATAPNPSGVGQPVTITATVSPTPASTCTPTGSVLFIVSADGPPLSAPLNAAGQATVSISSLNAGSHSVVAFYNGDGCFAGSASLPVTHVVA